jgi:hypothetical protein
MLEVCIGIRLHKTTNPLNTIPRPAKYVSGFSSPIHGDVQVIGDYANRQPFKLRRSAREWLA